MDPMNFAVVPITALLGDMCLSKATGFFYTGEVNGESSTWLVTNWHVLSGRSAEAPYHALHHKLALPDALEFPLLIRPDNSEIGATGELAFQNQRVSLFYGTGQAKWYQHQEQAAFDVGVIRLPIDRGRFHLNGINEVALQYDMEVTVGSQVFVLGYPLGFKHFATTPTWKRGSIASEPIYETPETRNRVVIDATTRSGMSGAPVVMREKTHYLSESGIIVQHPNATRFIGVYASRPKIVGFEEHQHESDRRAEVGYFYKSGSVDEIIRHGIPGPPITVLKLPENTRQQSQAFRFHPKLFSE